MREAALLRSVPKRLKGIPGRKVDPRRTQLEIDLEGLKAEYAVGLVLGLKPDLEGKLGGDDGHDLKGESTWQVKHNRYPHGDLYVNTIEEVVSDNLVLVHPTGVEAVVEIAGYVDKGSFVSHCHCTDYGYGTRYALSQDKLRSLMEVV